MKLKRIVASVLAIIMLLALAACGTNEQGSDSSAAEPISESQALSKARSYIESDTFGKQQFVNYAMPSGASSMYNIRAGSASCTGKYDNGSYEIVVKGSFATNDEYGKYYASYTYEATVTVSSTGTVNLYSSKITVRKA